MWFKSLLVWLHALANLNCEHGLFVHLKLSRFVKKRNAGVIKIVDEILFKTKAICKPAKS